MANIQTVSKNAPTQEHAVPQSQAQYQSPATDILENEEHYLLVSDMPGVSAESLSIQLESNVLSIEGKARNLDGAEIVYQREFRVGSAVDPDGLSAELKHGVLHLYAKKSASQKPKKIAVKVA